MANTQEQTSPAANKAKSIALLALDVDGVLSDGKLYIGPQGECQKAFSSRDGHGIKMLQRAGIEVAIITGRRSDIVLRRAKELKINCVVQGREDKWQALQELAKERELQAHQVAYMGDDWPDLPAIIHAGLGCTVANGAPELLARADWVSQSAGGAGAVRELCELILRAQAAFDTQLAPYQGEDS